MAEGQSPIADHVASRYRALLGLSGDLADYWTLDDLLAGISHHLQAVAPFDCLGLLLHDAERNSMRIVLLHPRDAVALPFTEVPVDFGPAGQVWQSQQTAVFQLSGDGPLPGALPILREQGIRIVCGVPLTTARHRLGVLVFGSRKADAYDQAVVELMEQVGRHVALAVEQAQHAEQLAQTGATLAAERDRVQLLLRVTNAVASEREMQGLLEAISRMLPETIRHHFASLTLWDPDTRELSRHALIFPAGRGHIRQGQVLMTEPSPARIAFERGEPMVFHQADTDRMGGEAARIMRAEGLQAACCVPLITARGKYGTLNVASPEADAFAPGEVAMLAQVGSQIAIAIENALHFRQASHYRRQLAVERDRLRLLLDLNNLLVSELDYTTVLVRLSEALRAVVPHDYASVALYDAGVHQMRLQALLLSDGRGAITSELLVPLDGSPAGVTYQRGEAMVFAEADLNAFCAGDAPILVSEGFKSLCAVPLVTGHGKLGTINVARRAPDAFSAGDVDLLTQISTQIAIAVENAVAYQEIAGLKDRLAEEKHYLEDEIRLEHDFSEIVGDSAAVRRALKAVETVAPTDATVLLLGETGTGKELLARALHHLSLRRDRTFVRLSGAALPATLVESELFGYEKGAFTGAVSSKMGRLELAHRGTLFLDEVGDIPAEVQPKLLRVLQEREFERLGSTRTERVDVRLIAATNRDLEQMVADGSFRSDLYYRLNVFPIHVPALRDRPEDIPALVRHFVQKYARQMKRPITAIPDPTMEALQRAPWPGNIRELENVIERAVILSPGSTLNVPLEHVPQTTTRARRPAGQPGKLRDAERDAIIQALRTSDGVIGGPDGAASRLGLKRTTLQSKMRKLGIRRPSF